MATDRLFGRWVQVAARALMVGAISLLVSGCTASVEHSVQAGDEVDLGRGIRIAVPQGWTGSLIVNRGTVAREARAFAQLTIENARHGFIDVQRLTTSDEGERRLKTVRGRPGASPIKGAEFVGAAVQSGDSLELHLVVASVGTKDPLYVSAVLSTPTEYSTADETPTVTAARLLERLGVVD